MLKNHILMGLLLGHAFLVPSVSQASSKNQPLQVEVFHNSDPAGFMVSSVILSGKRDAILLDTQFKADDAKALVKQIKDSGKTLKTIFITSGDPDYYFGLSEVVQAFPDAKVYTTPEILAHIQATADSKLKTWQPQLGEQSPKSIVYPQAFTGNRLTLEGRDIEIKQGSNSMKDHIYMYVPANRMVAGGTLVFGNLHVWTADNSSAGEQKDWMGSLTQMKKLKPLKVVPGHYQANTPLDASTIDYTRTYLERYGKANAHTTTSTQLIDVMKKAYPTAGLPAALDIGAKVSKGEMAWK